MDVTSASPGAARGDGISPREIVVFWIIRDSVCAECGDELGKGRFLRLEAERPLCLACADLDHLVFLPRGDAALTRRASRYSTLRAVVVRFSRARKRYERQGVMVEEAALARAEQECLSDAEAIAAFAQPRSFDAAVDTTGRATKEENHHDDSADGPRERRRRQP